MEAIRHLPVERLLEVDDDANGTHPCRWDFAVQRPFKLMPTVATNTVQI